MKCPRCKATHRRGRQGMVCRCGYPFVFDPKTDRITDGKFLAVVRKASANGSLYYTPNQLYAAACRAEVRLPCGILGLVLVVSAAVAAGIGVGWKIILLLGLCAGGMIVLRHFLHLFPRKNWDQRVEKWMSLTGKLDMMIQEKRLTTPPPEFAEPDLYDYGIEQVLLCERDEIVDWLVLNNFHVNTRCAVLGMSGYPSYLSDQLSQFYSSEQGVEKPKVFLLHDCGDADEEMEARVTMGRDYKFLRGCEVIDLGITEDVVNEISSLIRVRLAMGHSQLAVDMIPFTIFQAMATAAFSRGCSLAQLLEDSSSSGGGDGGDSGDGDGE